MCTRTCGTDTLPALGIHNNTHSGGERLASDVEGKEFIPLAAAQLGGSDDLGVRERVLAADTLLEVATNGEEDQ